MDFKAVAALLPAALVMALGAVLVLLYALAPFVLYGIYSRLCRLVDVQEHISIQLAYMSRQFPQPVEPAPPDPGADVVPAPSFRSLA